MSLAFSFQLTPNQAKFLLTCAFGHYRKDPSVMLPDFDSSHFVNIARKLQDKGLISHDPLRTPSYMVTDAGTQIATIIVRDAQQIVDTAKSAKPLPKPTFRKASKATT